MPETDDNDTKWSKQAAEKVIAALNRADEIGGEIRDFVQERVATDPRYVKARKAVAKLLGQTYESHAEVQTKAAVKAERTAAVAAVDAATEAGARPGFGDPVDQGADLRQEELPVERPRDHAARAQQGRLRLRRSRGARARGQGARARRSRPSRTRSRTSTCAASSSAGSTRCPRSSGSASSRSR